MLQGLLLSLDKLSRIYLPNQVSNKKLVTLLSLIRLNQIRLVLSAKVSRNMPECARDKNRLGQPYT